MSMGYKARPNLVLKHLVLKQSWRVGEVGLMESISACFRSFEVSGLLVQVVSKFRNGGSSLDPTEIGAWSWLVLPWVCPEVKVWCIRLVHFIFSRKGFKSPMIVIVVMIGPEHIVFLSVWWTSILIPVIVSIIILIVVKLKIAWAFRGYLWPIIKLIDIGLVSVIATIFGTASGSISGAVVGGVGEERFLLEEAKERWVVIIVHGYSLFYW